MKNIDNEALKAINGGLSLSGSILSAFTGLIKAIYGVGQDLGSAFRRISGGNLCSLD